MNDSSASVLVVLIAFLFSNSLAGQWSVSVSFHAVIDGYSVEQTDADLFLFNGLELYKKQENFNGSGFLIGFENRLKKNRNLRFELSGATIDHKICFKQSTWCHNSLFSMPINISGGITKSIVLIPEARFDFGFGLGLRYNSSIKYLGPGSNEVASFNGAFFYNDEIGSRNIQFTTQMFASELSLFIPFYFNFIFQLTNRVKMFVDLQYHKNIFGDLSQIDFRLMDSGQAQVISEPSISFGNFYFVGMGLKLFLY